MKIALFIPCFISSNYPEVGIATLELLERLGCSVDFPFDQTCCGQPLANEGDQKNAAPAEANFVRCFADESYDYIVGPSASCVLHIRENMDAIPQTEEVKRVRKNTVELVEFLHDVLKVPDLPWAEFPHKVALHNSCSSLRGLHIASMSELREEPFSKPLDLLAKVKGIEFVELDRPDECCGFGGLFSVFEEGVSAKMGYDKVDDQKRAGAEYVVSADMSCMMHQKGCAERLGYPQRYIHIAQVLNGYHGGEQ